MNRYAKLLKEQGLKVTSPRLEILRFLDTNKGHPNADTIYRQLKKNVPSLSRTTVYNTLELLKDKGMIMGLSITDKDVRYDIKTEQHQHFLCKGCGLLIEVDGVKVDMDALLMGKHRVDEYHGYYKGMCERCLNKAPRT